MTDIGDTVKDNVDKPRVASNEAGEVEQHRLTDQVEAAKFFRADAAKDDPFGSIHMRKVIPGGAT